MTPDDWQLYRRVRLAALKEAPYAFGSTYAGERDAPETRWRQTLRDRTRFVAEEEGVVAGTVSGGDGDASGAAAMTAMWVDPRFRRRGVGDLLVKTLLDWARSNGYGQMLLWVTDGNAATHSAYHSSLSSSPIDRCMNPRSRASASASSGVARLRLAT